MITKTGATVTKETAWEFFNFLESCLKDGVAVSFKANPGAMDTYDSLCNRSKITSLLVLKIYKNGLVHMAKVG